MVDKDTSEPLVDRTPETPKNSSGVEPLNEKQINFALELVEDRHKLKDTPFRITWPFLNYMCCCLLRKRKKRFDLAIKRSLRKKLALSVSKADARLEADPFLLLGYGLNSYFDIMKQLMILMAVITGVMIPSMLGFSSFGALAE